MCDLNDTRASQAAVTMSSWHLERFIYIVTTSMIHLYKDSGRRYGQCRRNKYFLKSQLATRGWRLGNKEKNKKIIWYPAQKKTSPGRMAQTSRAGTGDSMGRFRRYRCSTLFNYNCNLSLCDTFLYKLLPLPDNRRLLPTPKETYDLNLSAVTLSIWSVRIPTSIFCTKELYNPVFFSPTRKKESKSTARQRIRRWEAWMSFSRAGGLCVWCGVMCSMSGKIVREQ